MICRDSRLQLQADIGEKSFDICGLETITLILIMLTFPNYNIFLHIAVMADAVNIGKIGHKCNYIKLISCGLGRKGYEIFYHKVAQACVSALVGDLPYPSPVFRRITDKLITFSRISHGHLVPGRRT